MVLPSSAITGSVIPLLSIVFAVYIFIPSISIDAKLGTVMATSNSPALAATIAASSVMNITTNFFISGTWP